MKISLILIFGLTFLGCGSGESDDSKSGQNKTKIADANSGVTRFGSPPIGQSNANGRTPGTPPKYVGQNTTQQAPGKTAAPKGHGAKKRPTSRPAANPHARSGPRPTSRPASQPTSRPTSKSAHGSAHSNAAPAGQPSASGEVSGKISVSPDLANQIKPGHSLFIIVRRDEGPGKKGMILAVDKIRLDGPNDFPLRYTLTGRHVMTPGTVLSGAVRVSARVDQDGDALSKTPGDLIGAYAQAIQVSGDPIHFTLNEKIGD